MTPSLILSLFPGIDMLGMGFEQAGYVVLRGPVPLTGGDIREFRMMPNVVEGIIGGSPCQEFSRLNRNEPTGYGVAMVNEFARVVRDAQPVWFLLENVPGVPALAVEGYTVQRMHVRASEFGAAQHRLRIFQFGYRDGMPLLLPRLDDMPKATEPAALATAGKSTKRKGWAEFCALQGFIVAPKLESFTMAGRYRAVGNGVHLRVAGMVAIAISMRIDHQRDGYIPCACQCGREVRGTMYATPACRKRAQRSRDASMTSAPRSVTGPCEHAVWEVCQCRAKNLHCINAPRDPAAIALPGTVTA